MPAPLLTVQSALIFVSKFSFCLRQKTQSFLSKNKFRVFFFSHLMSQCNCTQDAPLHSVFPALLFWGSTFKS